jgi:hypothetical protein
MDSTLKSRLFSAAGFLGAGAVMLVAPDAFAAGGGNPISDAGQEGLTIAQGLGGLACAGGVIGTAAGGIMRSGAIMAGGATAAVCGGAWAGADAISGLIVPAGAGFSLATLSSAAPVDLLHSLSTLLISLIG